MFASAEGDAEIGSSQTNPSFPFGRSQVDTTQLLLTQALHESLAFLNVVHFPGHGRTGDRSQHQTPPSPYGRIQWEILHVRRKMHWLHLLPTLRIVLDVRGRHKHGQKAEVRKTDWSWRSSEWLATMEPEEEDMRKKKHNRVNISIRVDAVGLVLNFLEIVGVMLVIDVGDWCWWWWRKQAKRCGFIPQGMQKTLSLDIKWRLKFLRKP